MKYLYYPTADLRVNEAPEIRSVNSFFFFPTAVIGKWLCLVWTASQQGVKDIWLNQEGSGCSRQEFGEPNRKDWMQQTLPVVDVNGGRQQTIQTNFYSVTFIWLVLVGLGD